MERSLLLVRHNQIDCIVSVCLVKNLVQGSNSVLVVVHQGFY